MPGMGTFLQTKNPVVVSAFHTAILHQLLFIGLVLVVLSLVWNVLRTAQYRRVRPVPVRSPAGRIRWSSAAEPVARRVLRIGFGLLWIVDGLLQLQSAMPLGLPHQRAPALGLLVAGLGPARRPRRRDHLDPPSRAGGGLGGVAPARDRRRRFSSRPGAGGPGSPGWRRSGGGSSSGCSAKHSAGSSARVPPGSSARRAPSSSTAWRASWWPCPNRAWSSPRLGRLHPAGHGRVLHRHGRPPGLARPGLLAGLGARDRPGTLTAMVRQMAQTTQPGSVASSVRAFGRFDASHGWAVNLVVVVLLAADRGGLLHGRRRVVRPALYVAAWPLSGRLDPRPGPRVFRRRRDRSQQHGAHGARLGLGATWPSSGCPRRSPWRRGHRTAAPGRRSPPTPQGAPRRGRGGTGWPRAISSRAGRRSPPSSSCWSGPCPWRRRRQSQRRPDPGRGRGRHAQHRRHPGAGLPPRRPGRSTGVAVRICADGRWRSRSSTRSARRTAR